MLNAAARLARWNGPGPVDDRARGVAVVESFGSIVAQIAEVSAGGREGPRVHRVWCAVDCGIAVNPDVIRAQMEGGIGFGLGHALFSRGDAGGGRPVQGNFDDYRSLRMHEMPYVEVTIMRSSEKPTGVGEPGVPPIAPAVANALARLGLPPPAPPADAAGPGGMIAPRILGAVAGAIIVLTGAAVETLSQTGAPPAPALAAELRPVTAFAGIGDTQSRSIAYFEEAGKVLQHPRCVNCHPAGERPFQGDAMRPHEPLVVRGSDGRGASGLGCTTCHGAANFDAARVPGDSALAAGARRHGVGGQVARLHLQPAQGPAAQRQPRPRWHPQARGNRQPRQMGLEPGARPHAGTRQQRSLRGAAEGLGRHRRLLPAAMT